MDKNKLKVGDKVRVINYGSLLWENDKYGNLTTFDMSPELIGKEGVVSKVTKTQGVTEYAVDGIPEKHAWYDRDQLERLPSELLKQRDELLRVITQFVSDFESDYVMSDGRIVDNPDTILLENYKSCKEAINKVLK
jgi:hypothetical protein